MSDLTNKDAEQDTKLAVLESTVDNAVRRIEMVHQRIDRAKEDTESCVTPRIRKLEMWVAGARSLSMSRLQQLLSLVLLLQQMLDLHMPLLKIVYLMNHALLMNWHLNHLITLKELSIQDNEPTK